MPGWSARPCSRWSRSTPYGDPLALLGRSWDSVWYLGIAGHGYGHDLPSPAPGVHSDRAFFPLYPALVRALTAVLPLGGAPPGW
ncbi:hypothetical protein ACQ4WX_26700 [Streptomyces lasalocidi]